MSQKDLWDKLARENANYYIFTPGGRYISSHKYQKSGNIDYNKLIKHDPLVPKGGVILDFACGNGRITEFMLQDYSSVIGVDISEEMILRARDRLGEQPYDWRVTDGYELNLDSESVNVVLAAFVFPHMKERDMVESNFAEIHRVLVPGGVFKVYMKNDLGKEQDNRLEKWWNGITYKEEEARELAKGFEILQLTYTRKMTNYWLWLKKI